MVKSPLDVVKDRITATEEESASLRRGLDRTWSKLKEQAEESERLKKLEVIARGLQGNLYSRVDRLEEQQSQASQELLKLTSTLQSRVLINNRNLERIERLEAKLKELWGAFQNNTEVLEEMRKLVILHAEDKKRHNQGPSKQPHRREAMTTEERLADLKKKYQKLHESNWNQGLYTERLEGRVEDLEKINAVQQILLLNLGSRELAQKTSMAVVAGRKAIKEILEEINREGK